LAFLIASSPPLLKRFIILFKIETVVLRRIADFSKDSFLAYRSIDLPLNSKGFEIILYFLYATIKEDKGCRPNNSFSSATVGSFGFFIIDQSKGSKIK